LGGGGGAAGVYFGGGGGAAGVYTSGGGGGAGVVLKVKRLNACNK